MAPAAPLLPWLTTLALAGPALAAIPAALPPPPPPPALQQPTPTTGTALSGNVVRINQQSQQARWLLQPAVGSGAAAIWLPLEVLQNQLGVSSRNRSDGSLELEWFGRVLTVTSTGQRSLDDEVAVEVSDLLTGLGVQVHASRSGVLGLELPPARLLSVRSSRQGNQLRVVLDLTAPALIHRDGGQLWLGLSSNSDQQAELETLGLPVRATAEGLRLQLGETPSQRLFSLGGPERIVIDRVAASGGSGQPAEAPSATVKQPSDPRLLALLGRELHWEQQVRGPVKLTAVRIDPRSRVLALRPLTRGGGMEGLSSLQQLAARDDALVAINGGFFNRVKRLPLGALKVDGRWYSGPILGRGVVAWDPGTMPRFGRLQLQEWLSDPNGQRHPLVSLNSGYLQRGLSRYTSEWGPSYRALSGQESALVLREGRVQSIHDQAELEQGVALRPGDVLVVARGGIGLPWNRGDRLNLGSRADTSLGDATNVIGGGPLLLQNGRIVLNAGTESFSASFVQQGAPRTVIASDGRQLWLLTLEGINESGPSLVETATLLQQLGLQDALNLDGGSSTGLVIGGVMTVKGRGVAGAVHNGLGLVPTGNPPLSRHATPSQPTARVP